MGAFVANDDSPEEGRVAVAIGRFEVGALRMRRERNCDVFDQDLGDVHGGNGIAKTHRRHERSKPVGIGLVDKVVDGGFVSSLLIDKVEGCLLGGQNRLVEKRPLASDVCGRSWGVEILAVIFLHQNEPVGVGKAERGSDVGWRRLNCVDDADFSFRFGMRNGGLGEGVQYGGDDGRSGGEDGVRWEVVLGGVIVMVIVIVMVFPFMSTILLILRMGIAFIRRLMRIWEWIVRIGCDLGVCVGGVIIGRRVIGMVVGVIGMVIGVIGMVIGDIGMVIGDIGMVIGVIGMVIGAIGMVVGVIGMVVGVIGMVVGVIGMVIGVIGMVIGAIGMVIGVIGMVIGVIGMIISWFTIITILITLLITLTLFFRNLLRQQLQNNPCKLTLLLQTILRIIHSQRGNPPAETILTA